MNEGDQNSMHAMEILITGEKRDEKEKILTHHEKENQSAIQTKELTSSSTKFKVVRIINTLPISQFNQVISDKSGNYPRSPLLYVSSNNILMKYTLYSLRPSLNAFLAFKQPPCEMTLLPL